MKTRKQMLSEMIGNLEDDLVKQEVIYEYRKYAFENDERLKGNTEAEKELKSSEFTIDRTKKMLDWMNGELIKE